MKNKSRWTKREINAARNTSLYYPHMGMMTRVIRARTHKGKNQVLVIPQALWIDADFDWVEAR